VPVKGILKGTFLSKMATEASKPFTIFIFIKTCQNITTSSFKWEKSTIG